MAAPPLPHFSLSAACHLPRPSRPRELPPSFATPELEFGQGAPHSTFRNSLLFIDADTSEVLQVLPLASASAPPVPPKPLNLRAKKPVDVATPVPRSPPPSPGALIAAQVDEITRKMFPGHNLGTSSSSMVDSTPTAEAAQDREMRRIEADGSEQMARSGGFEAQSLVLQSVQVEDVEEGPTWDDERASTTRSATSTRTRRGIALLDEAMDLGSVSYLGPASVVSGAMVWRASIASTTAATDDGFETANEGEQPSRPVSTASSWADLARRMSHMSSSEESPEIVEQAEDNDPTPRPSLLSHPLEQPEENAVLLQFLGSGKDSTLRMRNVTGEDIGREGLVKADGEAGGWFGVWFDGLLGLKGLGSWIGGWWRCV